MAKVIIMSGISGSGKSTYVKNHFPGAEVVSADRYFVQKDGSYVFDPKKLGEAHAQCFRKFMSIVQDKLLRLFKEGILVVDNTNLTETEIAPYMLAASAYNWEAEIVCITCPLESAFKRNTHGLSQGAVDNQFYRLAKRKLPPFWKSRKVDAEGL